MIEQAKNVDILRIKEAFCIMLAEKQNLFNRDQSTAIWHCWKSQWKHHHVNPCTTVNSKPSSHEYMYHHYRYNVFPVVQSSDEGYSIVGKTLDIFLARLCLLYLLDFWMLF